MMKMLGVFLEIYTRLKKPVACCSIPLLFLGILITSRHAFGYTAYVVNNGPDTVSVIDTSTNTVVGGPISVGMDPSGIAITPNRRFAYVTNQMSGDVSVIDTSTNTVVGPPIMVGTNPLGIAITASGFAYVANGGSNSVSVINTNLPVPVVVQTITVGIGLSPFGVAINASGFVYVTNQSTPSVSVIDSNLPVPAVVATVVAGIGVNPSGIAITSAGFACVACQSGTVAVINTNLPVPAVVGTVAVANQPFAIAATPTGPLAYVTRVAVPFVSAIDTTTPAIPTIAGTVGVGTSPFGIAITPDGLFAYVANLGGNSISVLDITMAVPVVVQTIPMSSPFGIAIFSPPAAEPPTSLQGRQAKNDFGLVYEQFNLLQWGASPSVDPPVAGYFVYRNGVKIATLDAATFEYEDHNRPKGVSTLYSITAFDTDGEESDPIYVTVD